MAMESIVADKLFLRIIGNFLTQSGCMQGKSLDIFVVNSFGSGFQVIILLTRICCSVNLYILFCKHFI